MSSRIVATLWFTSAACVALAITTANSYPSSPAARAFVVMAVLFGLAYLAGRNAQ